jgi:beta-glucosidase
MSEHKDLLQDVLRKEWGFQGALVSDFEGIYSTVPSIHAGVALELPGPARFRGDHLLSAVREGQVTEAQIDSLAKDVITLASKIGVKDDGGAEQDIPKSVSTSALLREIAVEGVVLLKNQANALPLSSSNNLKIAVFGSPATTPIIHGGGSASLTPSYIVSPLEALERKFGKHNIVYHPGVPIFKKIPSASLSVMTTKSNRQPGLDCYWYNGWVFGENHVHQEVLQSTQTLVIDSRIAKLEPKHCNRMEFILRPETTGTHVFGVTACGKSILRVDDKVVLQHDGFDDCRVEYVMQPGEFEVRASLKMEANRDYHVTVDTLSTMAPLPSPIFKITPQATRVGFYENLENPIGEDMLELAATSDVSILFTANNKEYESESFDRSDLSLSPLQNQLISMVSRAAPKSVLVNQTGSPISMPWIDNVDAVLQSWYGGQEIGNALVDIISGDVNPSGKLPVTFPQRIEDTPSFGNFPTDDEMKIQYEEKLEMGYRARNKPAPLFPFGFGLSYTEFQFSKLSIVQVPGKSSVDVVISTTLTNSGSIPGKEVVQIYVDGVLKGWEKVILIPGESKQVDIALDKYAFSEWNPDNGSWVAAARTFEIDLRQDANTVISSVTHEISKAITWNGL